MNDAYTEWHCGECEVAGLTSDDVRMWCESCGATYDLNGKRTPDDDEDGAA